MNRFVPMFMLVLSAIVLAACASETGPTIIPLEEVKIVATDIAYDKDRIEVMVGQPLKITLQNDGFLEHDFSIIEIPHTGEVMAEETNEESDGHDMSNMAMDPEVHVASPSGGSHSVEFTPSQAGEYEFLCTVEGHEAAGMVGKLVVKDS